MLCKNLKNLDLSSYDSKKVNDISGMFYDCNSLKDINLSSFNPANLSNFQYIFTKCNNLFHNLKDILILLLEKNKILELQINIINLFFPIIISISSIFYEFIKSELNNNIKIAIK